MKIYLFSPETGLYLGEDFADEAPQKRGACVVPENATTITPPQMEPGDALLFNSRNQCWELRKGASSAENPPCDRISCDYSPEVSP